MEERKRNPIRFVFALHCHQPPGHPDALIAEAYERAYRPLVETLLRFDAFPVVFHFSGPLLEWIQANRPEYLDMLRRRAGKGGIEFLGGAYSDPILTMIPDEDLEGQIREHTDLLETLFSTRPRGIWIPERVWEPRLVTPLAKAGFEYAALDDALFTAAGLEPEALGGYFVSEDRGNLLHLFPISEVLRSVIPAGDPEAILTLLESHAADPSDGVMVFAEDGEKFGSRPGTYERLYEDGWLEAFFRHLTENRDRIDIVTFREAVDRIPAAGRIYLPEGSYGEMAAWALPTRHLERYEDLTEKLGEHPSGEGLPHFLRGGTWRNFRVKYPEAMRMYARMLEVSERLRDLREEGIHVPEASRNLYRAQCNSAYWHGRFAGIYRPRLRSAVYGHLLRAENLAAEAEKAEKGDDCPACDPVVISDFDRDGIHEILLRNPHMKVYIKPRDGGHMYELDVLKRELNLLGGLSRRREAYHRQLPGTAEDFGSAGGFGREAMNAPPDAVPRLRDAKAEEVALEGRLVYDPYSRDSLVDHFYPAHVTLDDLRQLRYGEEGDFLEGEYKVTVESTRKGLVVLEKEGRPWPGRGKAKLKKALLLHPENPLLFLRYWVDNKGVEPLRTLFGVELNFALLAGDAPDRFYWTREAGKLGPLGSIQETREREIHLVDENRGLDVALAVEGDGGIFCFPIETVSRSASGFERTYQSSALIFHWPLELKPGEGWHGEIRLAFGYLEGEGT
jgi:alpha-amylase